MQLEEARFWRLTPLQLDALLERHAAAQRREDLRVGVALSWLTAPHTKKPLGPVDFFPHLAVPEKPQTAADMIAVVKSLQPKDP